MIAHGDHIIVVEIDTVSYDSNGQHGLKIQLFRNLITALIDN